MHVSETLVALLPLLSFVHGIPTKKGSYSVHQVPTGKWKYRSGIIETRDTYLKYGKTPPRAIQKAAEKAESEESAASTGSVTATPEQYDQAYTCPVTIGTPGITLPLDFDTGSSDLWVFSSEMPASQRSGHAYYTPSSSSTSSLESGETWDISYGDGSGAAGNIYADKVVIGGVTATSQAVECATSVSSTFRSDKSSDGLVGLGFDNINTASPRKVPTFINTVAPQLSAQVFCAYLRHSAAGRYDFGYINSSSYTGSLDYSSVNTANGFWEFSASGYAVGSKTYSGSTSNVIADTGTSLVYLPDAVIDNYYNQVSGAEYASDGESVIFPCSSSLPNLSIIIDGNLHTIPGSYINYSPYSGSYCYGGLQSSDGIGFNILGDVFLKSQYAVFDFGNVRVGFGNQS